MRRNKRIVFKRQERPAVVVQPPSAAWLAAIAKPHNLPAHDAADVARARMQRYARTQETRELAAEKQAFVAKRRKERKE